jgi:hypothetical protein
LTFPKDIDGIAEYYSKEDFVKTSFFKKILARYRFFINNHIKSAGGDRRA